MIMDGTPATQPEDVIAWWNLEGHEQDVLP